MNLRTAFAAAAVLFAPAALAAAQTTAQPSRTLRPVQLTRRTPEELARMELAAHMVHLNVRVLDKSGKPVPGLGQADFKVLAAGQPQTITSFHDESGATNPVRILVALDAINSDARAYAAARRAVQKYLSLERQTQTYPVSLVRVSPGGLLVEPPQRDTEILQSILNSLPGPAPRGTDWPGELNPELRGANTLPTKTGPSDWTGSTTSSHTSPPPEDTHPADQNARFVASLTQLEKLADRQRDVPGRAILIWLGPGWPLLNDPRFLPDSPEIQTRYLEHLASLSSELRVAQVTLDGVASSSMLSDAGLHRGYADAYLTPAVSAGTIQAGNLSLPALALLSGGRVLQSEKDLANAIAQCTADANEGYDLTFISPPAQSPDEYRSIQVLIDRPGVTTRTIIGYYAEP